MPARASRCTTSCAARCVTTPARSCRRSSRGCSWPRRSRPTGRSPAGARRRRAAPTTAPPHPEVLPPPVRSLAAGRAGRPIARVRHAAVRSPGTLETGDPQDDSRSLCRHGCARLPARAARTHVRPAAGRAAPGRLARGRGPGAQGPARQYAGPAHASPGGRHVARRPARRRRGRGGHGHHEAEGRHRRPHEIRRPRAQPAAAQSGNQRHGGRARRCTLQGVTRENFDPREFEVGFQSPLDPYSSTKIFLSFENGNVSIEEGYAYWTGLPGHIRFDIGKFRQQFGEVNRWHLHALPETEYPLALRTYLGDDGLAGAGISLYRAFGGLGTHEVTAQVTRSETD